MGVDRGGLEGDGWGADIEEVGDGRRAVGKMHSFMHCPDHSTPWTDISYTGFAHTFMWSK